MTLKEERVVIRLSEVVNELKALASALRMLGQTAAAEGIEDDITVKVRGIIAFIEKE